MATEPAGPALAEELRRRGLAVLLMDYRGYGGNPGSPSEEGLAADAMPRSEALDDLGYPAERTIYFGESLGSGVVAALQARAAAGGSGAAIAVHRAGRRRRAPLPVAAGALCCCATGSPSSSTSPSSDVPVTVVYGDRDSVVPSSLSARVADEAPALAERVVIAGADHNDAVMFGPRVADAVARLARQVS